jgi:FMN phosphatase YigB (HAD superfamily)
MAHPEIKAVVFDAFGTLVEIGTPRRPYSRLISEVGKRQDLRGVDTARLVMAQPVNLRDTATALGAGVPERLIAELEGDLATELVSIRLFPDTLPALATIRQAGLRIGLCSNLAMPYGPPVTATLGSSVDWYGWSFELATIKPDQGIYRKVCKALSCQPHEVLFVGDTRTADYDGPRQSGMHALHLVRHGTSNGLDVIRTLSDVVPWLV